MHPALVALIPVLSGVPTVGVPALLPGGGLPPTTENCPAGSVGLLVCTTPGGAGVGPSPLCACGHTLHRGACGGGG